MGNLIELVKEYEDIKVKILSEIEDTDQQLSQVIELSQVFKSTERNKTARECFSSIVHDILLTFSKNICYEEHLNQSKEKDTYTLLATLEEIIETDGSVNKSKCTATSVKFHTYMNKAMTRTLEINKGVL